MAHDKIKAEIIGTLIELVRDSHHCKTWDEGMILALLCSRFRNDNILRDEILTSIGYSLVENLDLKTGRPVYPEEVHS